MTADDLLTRLLGRLTPLHLPMLALHAILDALRPECEAIAREMAELREYHEAYRQEAIFTTGELSKDYGHANASRVALRACLQRLVDTSQRWEGIRSTPSSRQAFRDARKAAEALLAHEPTQEPPR